MSQGPINPYPVSPDGSLIWNGAEWVPNPQVAPTEPTSRASAPTPEGWYPDESAPGKLRYWNGHVWTGSTKSADPTAPIPVESTAWSRKQMVLALLGVAALITIFFVGMGSSDDSGSGSPSTPTTADTTAWVPAGFTAVAPDVAMKWKQAADLDCSYYDTCAGIEVVSRQGCPSGVYVEMARVDSAGVLGEKSNQIGPAMGAGERAVLVVGWLGDEPGGKVKVTQISCMG